MVWQLIETNVIDLKNVAGVPELTIFQAQFHEYKIMVYSGLNCGSIMYRDYFVYDKLINLLFDEVTLPYHIVGNLKGAMAKR